MHLIGNLIIFLLVFLFSLLITKVLIFTIDKEYGFFELLNKKVYKSEKVKAYKIMSNIAIMLLGGVICMIWGMNPYNLGIILGLLDGIISAVFDERH